MPPPDPPPDQGIDISTPFNAAGFGAYQQTPTPKPAARDVVSYMTDTVLGMAQGVASIPAGIAGAVSRTPEQLVSPEQQKTARDAQDFWSDTNYWLEQAKSKAGQAEDAAGGPDITTDPVHAIFQGGTGIVAQAPLMMLGPFAPLAFGVQGVGEQANKIREEIRFADHSELMKAPAYKQVWDQTHNEEQAREALYQATNDATTNLIAGGGSAIGGGLLSHLVPKSAIKFLPEALTNKLMAGQTWGKRAVSGAAGGFAAGATMSGSADYAEQQAKYEAGLGPKPDMGAIALHAAKSGLTLAPITGVTHLAWGKRPTIAKPAADIGADTAAVAGSMARDNFAITDPYDRAPGARPTAGAPDTTTPTPAGQPLEPLGGAHMPSGGAEMPPGYADYEQGVPQPGPQPGAPGGPLPPIPGGPEAPHMPPGAPEPGRPDYMPPGTPEEAAYQPSEYGPGMGPAIGRPAPRPPPRVGGRVMRAEDIAGRSGYEPSEYGTEVTPQASPTRGGAFGSRFARAEELRRARRTEMQPSDLYGSESEYGPETPPTTPSPTGGGGGFGSRFARQEELRRARGTRMQSADLHGEYGPDIEAPGDVIQAGREMLPTDIYEPGSIEHGRARANEMLDDLEALKRRRERMETTGKKRGAAKLDDQISELRRKLIAHNRALKAGRVPEEEAPSLPSGGATPREPPSEPPREPPPEGEPPSGGGAAAESAHTAAQRAAEMAWHTRIYHAMDALPPVRKGHKRLFRIEPVRHLDGRPLSGPADQPDWLREAAERSGNVDAGGRWFADHPAELAWYARHATENGYEVALRHVDVPEHEAERHRVSNLPDDHSTRGFSRRPEHEFFVSREVADRSERSDIPEEPPPSNVVGLHPPDLEPRLAEHDTPTLREVLRDAHTHIEELTDELRQASARGDRAEMERIDRRLERVENVADTIEDELSERDRHPAAAERKRQEILDEQRAKGDRGDDSIYGVRGEHVLSDLGVRPFKPRVPESVGHLDDAIKPQTANEGGPLRPTLRARGRLTPGAERPGIFTQRRVTQGKEAKAPTVVERRNIGRRGAEIIAKAKQRVAETAATGEGEPVNARGGAALPTGLGRATRKTELQRRYAKEFEARAIAHLFNVLADHEAERKTEHTRVGRLVNRLVDEFARISDFVKNMIAADVERLREVTGPRSERGGLATARDLVRGEETLPLSAEEQAHREVLASAYGKAEEDRNAAERAAIVKQTDRERKAEVTARQYGYRENVARDVILNDPKAMTPQQLSAWVEVGLRQQSGEFKGRTARQQRLLAEGFDPTELPVHEQVDRFEASINSLPMDHMRIVARELVNEARARVAAGIKGYAELNKWMRETLGEAPQIRLNVASRGNGLWHARFGDYLKFIEEVEGIIGGTTKDGQSFVGTFDTARKQSSRRSAFNRLREAIMEYHEEELAVREGNIAVVRTARREAMMAAKAQIQRALESKKRRSSSEERLMRSTVEDIDAALAERWGETGRETEDVGGQRFVDEETQEANDAEKAMADMFLQLDRVANPEAWRSEGEARRAQQSYKSILYKFFQSVESEGFGMSRAPTGQERPAIPDVLARVRNLMDVWFPGSALDPAGKPYTNITEGSAYMRDARMRIVRGMLTELERRREIDDNRLAGKKASRELTQDELERKDPRAAAARENNRFLANYFKLPYGDWMNLPPEYKTLSLDFNTLIRPGDVEDKTITRIPRRLGHDDASVIVSGGGLGEAAVPPIQQTTTTGKTPSFRKTLGHEATYQQRLDAAQRGQILEEQTFDQRRERLQREAQSDREAEALAAAPKMSTGDLYLPFQEQLEFIRRLQKGEGSEADLALRGQQLTDKMMRLRDALQSIDPMLWRDPERGWAGERLQQVHGESRQRAGEIPEYPQNVTPDTVLNDFRRWSMELESIENEARLHYESLNPDVREMEYGIGKVLDGGADLRKGGNLPRGAYVNTIADFARESAVYGAQTANRAVRHFLNVANKIVGNLDVVHLTDEQMNMATLERGLPPDTPSFYDRVTDRLVFRQSALQGADRNHLLIHELAHPIMEAAAQSAKMRPIINRLEQQRAALKDAFENPDHPQHAEVLRLLDGNDHGLHDVHEFFSELWSNDNFKAALRAVKTSPEERDRWRTGPHSTLLHSVLQDIKRGLDGMFFNVTRTRLLNDSSIAALDLLNEVGERGRPGVYGPQEGEPLARAAKNSVPVMIDGHPVEVVKNPTPSDMLRLAAGSKYKDVRSIRDRVTHDVYAWNAEDGLHHTIGPEVAKDGYTDEFIHSYDGMPDELAKESHNWRLYMNEVRGLQEKAAEGRNPVKGEFYHGTPFDVQDGLHGGVRGVAWVTPSRRVAEEYANRPMMGAQRLPGGLPSEGARRPHVRPINVDAKNVFDMRKPEHRAIYEEIRAESRQHEDPDEHVGKANLSPREGLPGFGSVAMIEPYLRARGFDGMWADEGSQGRSLAIFLPKGELLRAPSAEQKARGRSYERAMAAKYAGMGEVRSATSYAQRMIDFGQTKYAGIMRTIKPLLEGAEVHIIPEHQFSDGMEFYDPILNKVFLKDTTNPQTQVHELVHAATARAIHYYPELRKALDRIIEEVKGSPEFERYIEEHGRGTRDYFTSKPEEFAAEFYANPDVRKLLDTIKTSPALLRDLKVTPGKKSLLRATLDLIAKWLNRSARDRGTVGDLSASVLGDVLKAQADLPKMSIPEWHAHEFSDPSGAHQLYAPRQVGGSLPGRPSEGFVKDVWQGLTERGKDIAAHVNQEGGMTGMVLKVMNFADLARTAEARRPGQDVMQDHVYRIHNVAEEAHQRKKEIMEKEDHQHWRALATELRVKSPGHVEAVMNYMDRANYVGATGYDRLGEGTNKWVGSRDEPGNRQTHNEWGALNRMWNALPESSQKMVKGLEAYYKGRYNAVRDATLRDLVHLRGFVEGQHDGATKALMKHITDGRESLTPAEVDLLKQHVRGYDGYDKPEKERSKDNKEFRDYLGQMRALPEFKKIAGVYYPMMRRGNYVVEAFAKLDRFAQPFGGVEQNREPGERPTGNWNFPSKEAANQFVDRMAQDDAPFLKIQKAYETADGKWRVDVNPMHLNFHASLRKAQEEHARLSNDPDMDVLNLQARQDLGNYAMNPTWATKLMKDMIESTKRTAAYRGLDETTQQIMSREWNEMAVRHLMSTSARSRYLPREYTSGASKDALDNLMQYSNNTANTLADLEFRPQMRDAVAAMDKYERDMRDSKDPEISKYGLRRSQVKNEVHNRLRARNDHLGSSIVTKAMQGILKLSFLDKLMSPGFLLLNASEPWTIAAPMLAGEHGMKAYGEMAKAYSILGAGRVWGAGAADFMKVVKEGIHGDPQLADTLKLLTDKIRETGFSDKWSTTQELIEMLQYLQKHGYLDRNAGMELAQALDPRAGVIGRGLNWVDNMFRQGNVAVENVNRGVAGIAGYRLAKMKDKSHEEAMRAAQDIVDKSAGNYGFINAPKIFNHPALKFAAQFKKYALRMTSNLIRVFAGAIRGEPGAMGQMVAMLASQQVISGALGMPTEPLKAMITVTNQLGINPYNTDDVERILNERLAGVLGRQGKDTFLYGLPRLLGTGFGARTGWDTLWTYGTLGNKRDDLAIALGHLAGGAPGGLLAEWLQGIGDASAGVSSYMHGAHTQGNESMVNAFRLLVPIKVIADALPALQDYFTGRQKPSGQPFDFKPNMLDTIQRIGGIRTSRDLAAQQARGAFIRQRDVYNADRTRTLQGYAQASNSAERAAIRDNIIHRWNADKPAVQRITYGDLQKAATAFERKGKLNPGDLGLAITKRTRPFAPNPDVYGFMPSGS